MAGSNGSPAQRGANPPQWSTESDEQARALELERWHQQQAQQRGYAQPHHGHPAQGSGYAPSPPFEPHYPGQGQGGYDAPPHHSQAYPSHNPQVRNPFDQPVYPDPADAMRSHGQFAPHFERFAPPAEHQPDPRLADPNAYPGAYREAQHQPHDPFVAQRGQQQFHPQHGYPPQEHQPPYQGQGEGRGDLQSWDLSHYQPGQIPQDYANHGQPQGEFRQPDWPPHPGAHEPQWQHPQPEPGQWPSPQDGHQPHGHEHYDGHTPGAYQPGQLDPGYDPRGPHDVGYDTDDLDAADETRRGPSTILVVSMLVGAIVVGGGLAFAYKQFGGSVGPSAKVAEVKRLTTPEKERPKDPGGKTIEHSDNKFLNRLSADAAPGEARNSDVEGAAKKVSTIPIVVNRDGSLTPQAPPPDSQSSSGVPGLVIDGLGPPPVPPQLRGTGAPPPHTSQQARLPPPPPPPPAARSAPRVADLPLPKVSNEPPPVTAAVERESSPRRSKQAERDDLLSQRASAGAAGASGLGSPSAPPRKPAPSTSTSGYVAVLASKKSRQDALNAFADLHSQYPDILGGITPDVREANLGDKGVWYRLIGGPPGSREAARSICVKLKAKGMKDCWPVAY